MRPAGLGLVAVVVLEAVVLALLGGAPAPRSPAPHAATEHDKAAANRAVGSGARVGPEVARTAV